MKILHALALAAKPSPERSIVDGDVIEPEMNEYEYFAFHGFYSPTSVWSIHACMSVGHLCQN
jgi:hypothetical protein